MKCPLKPKIVKYKHDPSKRILNLICREYESLGKDKKGRPLGTKEVGCGYGRRLPENWKVGDTFQCSRCQRKISITEEMVSKYHGLHFHFDPGPTAWAQEWGDCELINCPLFLEKENKCGIPPENININIPIDINKLESDVQNISMRASLI